ncbi:ASCH domain-containing protein [Streptomyces sp. NPDC002133]|uniref:ASCH domain-containing protein n=1 Tax=Streptomyces sp. NPDC002133 TaxID=3154409 RepID=UPI003332E733
MDGVPTLRFWRGYLGAVRAGTKTTTVRFRDPVEAGPVSLVFDDEVILPGTVTQVVATRVADLTVEEALLDGFPDLATLHARLQWHYPEITQADEVCVVHFRVTGRATTTEGPQ